MWTMIILKFTSIVLAIFLESQIWSSNWLREFVDVHWKGTPGLCRCGQWRMEQFCPTQAWDESCWFKFKWKEDGDSNWHRWQEWVAGHLFKARDVEMQCQYGEKAEVLVRTRHVSDFLAGSGFVSFRLGWSYKKNYHPFEPVPWRYFSHFPAMVWIGTVWFFFPPHKKPLPSPSRKIALARARTLLLADFAQNFHPFKLVESWGWFLNGSVGLHT